MIHPGEEPQDTQAKPIHWPTEDLPITHPGTFVGGSNSGMRNTVRRDHAPKIIACEAPIDCERHP